MVTPRVHVNIVSLDADSGHLAESLPSFRGDTITVYARTKQRRGWTTIALVATDEITQTTRAYLAKKLERDLDGMLAIGPSSAGPRIGIEVRVYHTTHGPVHEPKKLLH